MKQCVKTFILEVENRSSSYLNVNRKGVYYFLLMTNSNLGPISHSLGDMAKYLLKIANFCVPPFI